MGIYNPASDGFPTDKVKEAVRYITALKPHWAPMVSVTTIVPSTTDTLPGERFAAITSTDKDGNIYIDRSFALNSTVPEIAAAIEFQYQLHIRRMWERMSWLPEDEWHDIAPMAMSLEVNSAMDTESKRISPNGKVQSFSLTRMGLTAAEIEQYGLGVIPSTRSIGGFFPDELDMEPGLTAEEYARIIRDAMQNQDLPEPDEQSKDGSGEGGDGSNGENDPQEAPETGQEGESGDEEVSGSSEEESGPQGDGDESGESGDGQSGDDDSESDGQSDGGQDQPNDQSDSGQSGSDSSDGQGGNSGDESDEGSGDGGDDAEGEEGQPSDDPQDGAQSGGKSVDNSSTSGDSMLDGASDGGTAEGTGEVGTASEPSGMTSDHETEAVVDNGMSRERAQEIMDKIEEKMNDPRSSMWENSIHNPDDPLDINPMEPDTMEFEDNIGKDAALDDALNDVYEDLIASSMDPGVFTGEAKDQSIAVAARQMKKRKADFASRQRRVTVSAVQSARVSGATDMSLAVRNPNQPMIGPIMPGTFDYSPRIYCIQDVSGSMKGAYTIAAGRVFQDVTTDVAANFNAKTLWIAVDFRIKSVSEQSRWDDEQIWNVMYYGGGLTDISEIAVQVSQGKLVYEGKRYPEPDVLCILTDGKFNWPERRPRVKTKWIITTFKSCIRYLPDWLRKDEIVTID